MKTRKRITVYVTGYEAVGAISGWDWFPNKESADARFKEIEQEVKSYNEQSPSEKSKGYREDAISYRGSVRLDITNLGTGEVLSDNINNAVELWLGKHDFENAFKKKAK